MTGNTTRKGILLGVTGGIASGKSTVARMLEEAGAPMIDFDVLARIVVEPGRPAYRDIVAFFGDEVLLPDGDLDRARLSQIVFSDPDRRRKLESFTHPRIGEEFARRVAEHRGRDPEGILQAVVPLLVEAGMQALFDRILLVYAPEAEQVRRLMLRDGVSEESARSVLSAQLPIERKREAADFVIDNSGPLESTRRQVEALYPKLEELRREGTV